MTQLKDTLSLLLAMLADFERDADRAERKAAILPLQRLAKKLEIRSLELQQQRWMLTAAESTRDRETLRDLAENSQFEEITSWALEILNPNRARVLAYQTIQL